MLQWTATISYFSLILLTSVHFLAFQEIRPNQLSCGCEPSRPVWKFEAAATDNKPFGEQKKDSIRSFWDWHDALWIDEFDDTKMVKCLFRMPCAVNYLALWCQTTASEIFLSPVKPRGCVGIIVFLVAKHWKGMFIQSSGVLGVLCIGGLMWFVYRRFSQLLPICFGHHCSFQILHTQDMPRWTPETNI